MKVFITGGCKNGKSTYAEKIALALAGAVAPCFYVATMKPMDAEDEERIVRHKESRKGLGFETVEWQVDIGSLANHYDHKGAFLLDSTTALLANEMFTINGEVYETNFTAPEKVMDELDQVMEGVANVVVVSDYMYADTAFYDDATETYRRGLSLVDQWCAAKCDVVIEVCHGQLIFYKGETLMEGIYETMG